MKNKALSAWLLADPKSKLDLVQDANRIEIKVPDEAPDSILSIVFLQFDGNPEIFPVPSAGKLGTASSVDSTTVEPLNPLDNQGQEFTLQYKNGDKWVLNRSL